MSRKVHITTKAANDIDKNVIWWAENRSTEQASLWYYGIQEFIDTLLLMPESHSLIPENITSDYETCEAYFGLSGKKTHRVIFRILPGTIEILLVRHLARGKLTNKDLQ